MPGKNKSNQPRQRPDTDVSRNEERTKNRRQTNNSNNGDEINRGNTINTGSSEQTNELPTKKSVAGSDSDGQAE